jgi:hypothetical protein
MISATLMMLHRVSDPVRHFCIEDWQQKALICMNCRTCSGRFEGRTAIERSKYLHIYWANKSLCMQSARMSHRA